MNSISMDFHSLYCKIPDHNLSPAHIIFDISLGKRQYYCDQAGIHYQWMCMYCLARLLQLNCIYRVRVRPTFSQTVFYPAVFDTNWSNFITYLSLKLS